MVATIFPLLASTTTEVLPQPEKIIAGSRETQY
jgi:hypothetical protein